MRMRLRTQGGLALRLQPTGRVLRAPDETTIRMDELQKDGGTEWWMGEDDTPGLMAQMDGPDGEVWDALQDSEDVQKATMMWYG
jgi:hypothetical protein